MMFAQFHGMHRQERKHQQTTTYNEKHTSV